MSISVSNYPGFTRRFLLKSLSLPALVTLFPSSLSTASPKPIRFLPTLMSSNIGFLKYVHWEITEIALDHQIPWHALDKIVVANINQDGGEAGGDPLNHGDDNRIEETIRRIDNRIKEAQSILNTKSYNEKDIEKVLVILGQVCHAGQDLVSHSNYVEKMTEGGRKYKAPKEVPPPNWLKNGRPKGIVTGTWDPKNKNAHGTPEHPTHEDLNKDGFPEYHKHSPSSAKKVPGMPNKNMFDVAMDVAIRETQVLYKSFLEGLTKDGLERWDKVANDW